MVEEMEYVSGPVSAQIGCSLLLSLGCSPFCSAWAGAQPVCCPRRLVLSRTSAEDLLGLLGLAWNPLLRAANPGPNPPPTGCAGVVLPALRARRLHPADRPHLQADERAQPGALPVSGRAARLWGWLASCALPHGRSQVPWASGKVSPASAYPTAPAHTSALPTHLAHSALPHPLLRRCIPKNCPGADWRVLEEIVKADPSREKFKVRAAGRAVVIILGRRAREGTAQLLSRRSWHACVLRRSSWRAPHHCTAHPAVLPFAPPALLQGQPLVPWCLPNTADRHNGWRGLFGRLDWQGHFPTSTTDPQPMGKVRALQGGGWKLSLEWPLGCSAAVRANHASLPCHSPADHLVLPLLLCVRRWARCSTPSRTASCRCASAPAPRCEAVGEAGWSLGAVLGRPRQHVQPVAGSAPTRTCCPGPSAATPHALPPPTPPCFAGLP